VSATLSTIIEFLETGKLKYYEQLKKQVKVDIEGLNGFFVIARTIGLCGHWVDQKKNNSRLLRLFEWLVHWGRKDVRDVPPLK